jgi:hypothetical protein
MGNMKIMVYEKKQKLENAYGQGIILKLPMTEMF